MVRGNPVDICRGLGEGKWNKVSKHFLRTYMKKKHTNHPLLKEINDTFTHPASILVSIIALIDCREHNHASVKIIK